MVGKKNYCENTVARKVAHLFLEVGFKPAVKYEYAAKLELQCTLFG